MDLIVLGGVIGLLIGWAADQDNPVGAIIGGLIGLGLGAWLRSAIRREIADALRQAGMLGEVRHAPPPPTQVAQPAVRVSAPAPVVAPVAAPAAPVPPPPPVEREVPGFVHAPTSVDRAIEAARGWLLGGNTIVRAGLVVLFLGLVFLARFAALAGLFPIEARLALVGAGGVALLLVGLRTRVARPDFGLSLQGAGVAVLYLTIFAAGRGYGVLPMAAAFGFMIAFAALGCALAVMQDSLAMALAAFVGGFAVPVLLGGHADTPLGLFAYITVLNGAILVIAWRKSWRALNLTGFVATFLLAFAWGFSSYAARDYALAQAFLAVSVAIYLAMALLYAHNTPGKLGNFADSTLLFGTALAGFGMQVALVHDRPYASAFSALAFGSVYIGLTAVVLRRRDPAMRLLGECLLAIGVGFVTLAIPLALDVKWTSSAWALEGAGAFWVGARQARWMPRAMGLVLQGVAAVLALGALGGDMVAALPLANDLFLRPMLVAGPMLWTAWLLRRDLPHSGSAWALGYAHVERGLRAAWFLGGFALIGVAILAEVNRHVPGGDRALGRAMAALAATVAMLAAMALAEWLGRARDWPVARWPSRASGSLVALALVIVLGLGHHVPDWPDVALWVPVLALAVWLLRAQPVNAWTQVMHTGSVLLGLALVADILWYGIDHADLWDTAWAGVVYLASATLVLLGLAQWAGRDGATGWPLAQFGRAYWWYAGVIVAVLVLGSALAVAMLAEGVADPLPFVPIVNPVDLSVLLAIAALALWRRAVAQHGATQGLAAWIAGKGGLVPIGALGFLAANAAWARVAHHWLGVEWSPDALAGSAVVEAGCSLLWTLIAFGAMLYARSRAERVPWLAGAGLLAAVVAKLVLFDMASVQGLARIVAFIGVGVLMLLIGWFVPLPPRQTPPRKNAAEAG